MPHEINSIARYGPALKEYLLSKQLNRLPSVNSIRRAIRTLSDPEKVTCETFETILYLGDHSIYTHLPILLSEDARAALPACIGLIETYCQGGRRLLLDRAYGFLCLQVLSLLVQYTLLSDHGYDKLLFSITGIPDEPIVEIFNGSSMKTLVPLLRSHDSNKDIEVTNGFGWHIDRKTGKDVCFPQIGGCSTTQVQSLVQLIWASRAQLLLAAQWSTVHFPGLAGLLCWIWSGIARKFGTSQPTPISKPIWVQFADLIIRYSLQANEIEGTLLKLAVLRSPQFTKTALFNLSFDSAVNDQDSALISRYTLGQLQICSNLPMAVILFCFAFPNIKSDLTIHKLFTTYLGVFWLGAGTRKDPNFFDEKLFVYCQSFVHALTRYVVVVPQLPVVPFKVRVMNPFQG
ncbi:unnamed protein product [Rhizoctonia solani]|uniref:Uncharacterized protein n=1 Tax=Rhizoctonia solani TaxID=456999 RepID=A0A8H3CQ24_9AGAM|nr:unnamed protein product [Rhizoctonia solani]